MSVLNQTQKDIIKKYPIGHGMRVFPLLYRDIISKDPSLSTGDEIVTARFKSKGAQNLLKQLFFTHSGLPAYRALNDLADFLRFPDLGPLILQLPSDINSGALSTLLDCMINRPEEEELIWSASYNFFPPKILTRTKSTSPPIADSVIVGLYNAWHCPYLIDSLAALRQQMRDCTHDCSYYYAKTFVFVQSSGMGKSRVVDIFGKSYLMINFILYKDDSYPPDDTEILQFILSEPPDKVKESVNKLPQKKPRLWAILLLKPEGRPQYGTIMWQ